MLKLGERLEVLVLCAVRGQPPLEKDWSSYPVLSLSCVLHNNACYKDCKVKAYKSN